MTFSRFLIVQICCHLFVFAMEIIIFLLFALHDFEVKIKNYYYFFLSLQYECYYF